MPSNKQIYTLNNLLGQEMGRNKYGESRYKWQHSDTYMHHMVLAGKRDYGEMVVRNEDGTDSGKRLTTLKRVTALRKMCLFYNNQWLITVWKWSPESLWRAHFGSDLEWPSRGMYFPVDGSALKPGLDPSRDITVAFINSMKRQMSKSLADMQAETEKALELEEKASGDNLYDKIDDLTSAWGNPKPGSRMGGISTPSVEFRRGYDVLNNITNKNCVEVVE